MKFIIRDTRGNIRNITRGILITLVAIFLLSDSRFLYLIPLSTKFGGSASNKLLMSLISVVCFLFMLIIMKKFRVGLYGKDIIFVYIFILLQMIWLRHQFNYSITTLIAYYMTYIILLMYFVLSPFLNQKNNFEYFIKIIEIIVSLLSILLLIQLYFYNSHHHIFLNFTLGDWYTLYHPTASGRFYSVSDGLTRVAIPLSFYRYQVNLNKGSKDIFSLTTVILGMLAILLVDQSRIYFLQEIVTIFVMYLSLNLKKITLKRIIMGCIVGIIFIILVFPKISSILMTLSDGNSGSIYARQGAIEYYLSIGKEYLFTGLGLVIPEEGNRYYYLIKGADGIFNYDDIGIFGVFASLGILITLWYIFILFKNYWLAYKVKDRFLKSLSYGLATLMLTGIGTMSYLDGPRIVDLLLTMVIITYSVYKNKETMYKCLE